LQRPVRYLGVARLDRLGGDLDLASRRARGASEAISILTQSRFPAARRLVRQIPFEALPECLEGAQLDLGVARAGQASPGVAVAPVFGPVKLPAEVLADQPQQRPQLLEVFASAVDGGRQLILLHVAEPPSRRLRAAQSDPANAVRRRLLFSQAIGLRRARWHA
jgi:hypothetical protein